MKRICAILTLVVVLTVATSAFAGPALDKIMKKGELVVGTSGDYPPFSAKSKDGKLMGFDVDLAGMIADAMNLKVKVIQIPFVDLLTSLETGKIDMVVSAMTITTKRNLKFAFVGPYFVSGQALLTTEETAIRVGNIKEINKADFVLAVPAGTTSELIAKKYLKSTQLIVTNDMDSAAKLLLDGKVNAVLTDNATATVVSFRFNSKGIISTGPITFELIGIAIPGDDSLFINFLENLIGTLKAGGELDELTEKWFKNSSWVRDLP
ncbi:MAG: transporter substrate-binding domain-containing protein [Syntrophobacterales bacterium]|jgi:polar amino acid transport system substrate-binding protein|nr:transporter substrate-binding domain-containing protein [Syntrophobacterales bacterium]